MTNLHKAFALGCKLAVCKFAEDNNVEVDTLTEALDSIMKNKSVTSNSRSVLDSSERSSSSSWGNKMELETPKNTGINV